MAASDSPRAISETMQTALSFSSISMNGTIAGWRARANGASRSSARRSGASAAFGMTFTATSLSPSLPR